MPNITVLLIGECGHVIPGTPNDLKGKECPVCRKEVKIQDVHRHEWHAFCASCPWGRWCGLSRVWAERQAANHWRRTNHETYVSYDKNPAAESVWKRMERHGLAK